MEHLVDWPARSGCSAPFQPDARVTSPHFGSDELPDEIVVQVLDLHRRVRACPALALYVVENASTAPPHLGSLRRSNTALTYIATTWDSIARALNTPASTPYTSELIALINRLRALENHIHSHWSVREAEFEARAVDAIGNLYRCRSLDALIHRIPVEVAGLGFDRVLFSSANGTTWIPRAAHCSFDPQWSRQYLDGIHDHYALPGAASRLQTAQVDDRDMLRHKTDDRAFDLWRRSRSKRFWMIPLSDHGRLMGMLHVDCLGESASPLRPQFSALRTLGRAVPGIVAHSLRSGGDSGSIGTAVPASATPSTSSTDGVQESHAGTSSEAGDLSTRELDVVALMAQGMTNAQIGRRLVITEGTVKSHVKRILKKTESANRAEAVAKWMHRTPQPSAA